MERGNERPKDQNLCKLLKFKESYGPESLSFREGLPWNTHTDKIKQSPSLAEFQNQIKSWTGDKCSRKPCLEGFFFV